jgi:hypothetical protein
MLLCKPSICTLSCSWVCDIYIWQTSNYEKSFPGGGDDIPCILNNNDKLLISSFMSMDWNFHGYIYGFQVCF